VSVLVNSNYHRHGSTSVYAMATTINVLSRVPS